jgi:hypothetical protein
MQGSPSPQEMMHWYSLVTLTSRIWFDSTKRIRGKSRRIVPGAGEVFGGTGSFPPIFSPAATPYFSAGFGVRSVAQSIVCGPKRTGAVSRPPSNPSVKRSPTVWKPNTGDRICLVAANDNGGDGLVGW